MPRPSRNVDVQLLAAGRELYPADRRRRAFGPQGRRARGRQPRDVPLSLRQQGRVRPRAAAVAVRGDVRGPADRGGSATSDPVSGLRAALKVIARFARDNRVLLAAADRRRGGRRSAGGRVRRAPISRATSAIVVGLIAAAQQAGRLKPRADRAGRHVRRRAPSQHRSCSAARSSRRGSRRRSWRNASRPTCFRTHALDERIDLALAGARVRRERRHEAVPRCSLLIALAPGAAMRHRRATAVTSKANTCASARRLAGRSREARRAGAATRSRRAHRCSCSKASRSAPRAPKPRRASQRAQAALANLEKGRRPAEVDAVRAQLAQAQAAREGERSRSRAHAQAGRRSLPAAAAARQPRSRAATAIARASPSWPRR